jgi:hypothetical protein
MLRAGAAMAAITPRAGTHLGGSGMGEHRPAQSVLDPLYAKALVLEAGGQRVCIVALDLVIIAADWVDRIRTTAASRYGLDPAAIVVHAVQTHSAPSLGHFMLDPDFPLELPPEREYMRGGDPSYYRFAAERSVEAIGRALAALRPVQMGWARAVRHDLAFNRRGINRRGEAVMPWPSGRRQQPLGPTELLYTEGPADPEVGIVGLREDDLSLASLLLFYTCHPVNVFSHRHTYHAVSADWPGAWSAGMQQACGSACVPLVLNGACGNVNPWDPFDPEFVPDHRRMGAELTRTSCQAVPSMPFVEVDTLRYRSRSLALSYRDVPAERLAEVERVLSASPTPAYRSDNPDWVTWEWFAAASTRSIECCRRRLPAFQYELQVVRVGDVALVFLPGEPFTEGQLAIKLRSPAPFTQVVHMTSHYVGYVPPRAAYERYGHEANRECTYWAKLAPGSLEQIVDAAVETVTELFTA